MQKDNYIRSGQFSLPLHFQQYINVYITHCNWLLDGFAAYVACLPISLGVRAVYKKHPFEFWLLTISETT